MERASNRELVSYWKTEQRRMCSEFAHECFEGKPRGRSSSRKLTLQLKRLVFSAFFPDVASFRFPILIYRSATVER